jgi:ABC-type enterochelin transport system substrate-binding protein
MRSLAVYNTRSDNSNAVLFVHAGKIQKFVIESRLRLSFFVYRKVGVVAVSDWFSLLSEHHASYGASSSFVRSN